MIRDPLTGREYRVSCAWAHAYIEDDCAAYVAYLSLGRPWRMTVRRRDGIPVPLSTAEPVARVYALALGFEAGGA